MTCSGVVINSTAQWTLNTALASLFGSLNVDVKADDAQNFLDKTLTTVKAKGYKRPTIIMDVDDWWDLCLIELDLCQ